MECMAFHLTAATMLHRRPDRAFTDHQVGAYAEAGSSCYGRVVYAAEEVTTNLWPKEQCVFSSTASVCKSMSKATAGSLPMYL